MAPLKKLKTITKHKLLVLYDKMVWKKLLFKSAADIFT